MRAKQKWYVCFVHWISSLVSDGKDWKAECDRLANENKALRIDAVCMSNDSGVDTLQKSVS